MIRNKRKVVSISPTKLLIPIFNNGIYNAEKEEVMSDFKQRQKNVPEKQEVQSYDPMVELGLVENDSEKNESDESEPEPESEPEVRISSSMSKRLEAQMDDSKDTNPEIALDGTEETTSDEGADDDASSACSDWQNCESYKASQGEGVSVSQLLKLPSKHGRCLKCGVSLTKDGTPRKRRK